MDAGAIYAFLEQDGHWTAASYLKASNAGAGDKLGGAVTAASTFVAGAAAFEDSDGAGVDVDAQDSNALTDSGAAYVFR